MLKYFWTVTQDLFLTVTYATLIHALLSRLVGKRGRVIHGICLGVGAAAAFVLAAMKYTTNLIISSRWNHYMYAVYLALILIFLILTLIFGRKEGAAPGAGGVALAVVGGLISATLILYSLPGVLLYPLSFNTMGNGVFSSYYMERLAGWLLALLLLLLYARMLDHCARLVRPCGLCAFAVHGGLLSFGVYCAGRFFVPWVNGAKWLGWPVRYREVAADFGWASDLMMFSANYAMLFIWIALGLAALIAVAFFCQSTRVTEPYANSAQLRKLRARNRRFRRTAAAALACAALSLLAMTYVKAEDTRPVTLSAPETYTVSEGKILIPIENVSDGHLHRFEYRTEKNIDVRWIVVKKPGSASFGVGLDACDVCGNAGYYERSGQVICKRCDVVMNINTIGFKGGCNPIPLNYEVDGGHLVFDLADILAGEKEFR